MGVEKNQDWGGKGPLPPEAAVVRSDSEARHVLEAARDNKATAPTLGLAGGDLAKTLGGSGDEARLRSSEAFRAQVDLGVVLMDGKVRLFVAHLVAKRSWLRGPVLAAMNAEWLSQPRHSPWCLGPKAHPGDGLLDVLEIEDMALAERLKAWKRLPGGAFLPHPDIASRRTKVYQVEYDKPVSVWLDGEAAGKARTLSIRVDAGALDVVV